MEIAQYIIWFGFFLAGTYAHEVAHFFIAAILKLSPRMDLWKLEVSYNYTPIDWKVRLIGLAPLILGIIYFCFEILYITVMGGSFRIQTIIFLIALLIGTSPGDLSVSVARRGTWRAYDDISRGIRLIAAGSMIGVVSWSLKFIPGENLAIEIIKGAMEVSSIVVITIGAAFYFWDFSQED